MGSGTEQLALCNHRHSALTGLDYMCCIIAQHFKKTGTEPTKNERRQNIFAQNNKESPVTEGEKSKTKCGDLNWRQIPQKRRAALNGLGEMGGNWD